MATNRINARQNWQLGFFYAPVKIFFGFSQTRSALHAMGTCRTPCYMLHGLEGLIRTYTNQTPLLYCIHTLPRRGINWEILPPRTKRFPKSRDFAPRGPRDCPRAISSEVLSDLNLLSKLVSDHFTDQKNLYEACPWPFWIWNRLPNVSNLLFDDFPISISQRRSWDCVFWDSGP